MIKHLLSLITLTTPVLAVIQTWNISGVVTSTINTGASFTIGQRWTASFNVDYSAAVGDSGPGYAGYTNAASSLSFSTAGYTLSSPSSSAWVYVYDNDVYGTPIDLLETSFHSPSGPSFAGPSLLQFMLRDSDRSSIAGTSIPSTIDLSSWTNDNSSFLYWGTGPAQSGLILSIDAIAIPEPSNSPVLLGLFTVLYILRIHRKSLE